MRPGRPTNRRRITSNVVPAKAGTHNPWAVDYRKHVRQAPRRTETAVVMGPRLRGDDDSLLSCQPAVPQFPLQHLADGAARQRVDEYDIREPLGLADAAVG